MPKRPRQTDVAKLAGVSPATVSVILNNRLDGNVRISAETRARVLQAVEELGYVTNPVARSLAGGHNSLLGLFTCESFFPLQPSERYDSCLAGIEQEAEKLGYNLLLFTGTGKAEGQRRIYQGNVNRLHMADGAILLGAEQNKQELAWLVAEGYPFVLVGRSDLEEGELAYVAADYATATATIVTEMIALGHRNICYLGRANENEPQRDRYRGYLAAHRKAGLHQQIAPAHRLAEDALAPSLVQQLLDQGTTAFVLECGGNLTTYFLQAMAQLGKQTPRDFSLAVLDDPVTNLVVPGPITSLSIPRDAMGRKAVTLVAELLQTPRERTVRQATFACSYSPGGTIGPPAN